MVLYGKYGPATVEIEQILDKAESLTAEEAAALGEAWRKDDDALITPRLDAFGRGFNMDAWGDHRGKELWAMVARGDTMIAAPTRGALMAALHQHAPYYSPHWPGNGFTHEDYALLSGPWVSVFGPIFADERELKPAKTLEEQMRLEVLESLIFGYPGAPVSKNWPTPWAYSDRVGGWVHNIDGLNLRELCIVPQLFNYKVTLGAFGDGGWEIAWEYDSVAEMVAGVGAWDGEECGGDWVRRISEHGIERRDSDING